MRNKQAVKTAKPAKLYRPTVRPPVALLTIYDDGSLNGEAIRVRQEQFIIGRSEGDLQLTFDELLSSRHFAISRQLVKGNWRWVVTDLQSKNGVFFRVSRAPLAHNSEVLIGKGCYRFQFNQNNGPDTADWSGGKPAGTRALAANQNPGVATLTEVVHGAMGQRTALTKDAYLVGSSTSCDIVRVDDPFAEPIHAQLARSENGTWVMHNQNARNGVWIRLPQISIGRNSKCEFQAGEQRFKLSFGGKE